MKKKLKLWFKGLQNKKSPDEFEAKQLVKLYSIKTPHGKRFKKRQKLDIDDIKPPYVLKVCSPNILHKTEQKGVILNNSQKDIKANFKIMRQRFVNEHILVENQIKYTGPEFIIGIVKDNALGHAVMVGAGGILTEIYKDTAFRLAPCSVNEAKDMIDELILSPVFENFRGMTLDKKKLAQTISKVSKLADDLNNKISQLDINPIVFCKKEWIALDVKIVLG